MTPPPFDPPYSRLEHLQEGLRITETSKDGSTHVRLAAGKSDALSLTRPFPPQAAGKAGSAIAAKPVRPASSRACLFLKVPFAEKDMAKKAGARWDADRRAWYVPQGSDIAPFRAWWPEDLK